MPGAAIQGQHLADSLDELQRWIGQCQVRAREDGEHFTSRPVPILVPTAKGVDLLSHAESAKHNTGKKNIYLRLLKGGHPTLWPEKWVTMWLY